MAFLFDEGSKKITLPLGDTMNLSVKITSGLYADGDTVMFALSDSEGKDAICKAFTISDGKCTIRLNSADTADMEAGSYTWNIRLVHTAETVDGKIQIDDTDEVLTLFNKPPRFVLVDGGCDV